METVEKVSCRRGLATVNYVDANEQQKTRAQEISDAITKAFDKKSLPEFFSKDNDYELDIIKLGNRIGYAFAISKLDEKFSKDISPGLFRYRHNEVANILKKIVKDFGLSGEINYNDGFGVFVYNIWEK